MWPLITCHSPHWNNPSFISRTITEIWVTSLALDWLRAKILSYSWLKSKPFNSNYFCTDLPSNFWKIAKLLGKIKNIVSLRFISSIFSSKTSSSKRTCAYYWQWIPMVRRRCFNMFIAFKFFVPALLGIVFLCCKVFETVKVGLSTLLTEPSFRRA